MRLRPRGFMREVAFAESWAVADRLRAKELLEELRVAGVQELRQRAPGSLEGVRAGISGVAHRSRPRRWQADSRGSRRIGGEAPQSLTAGPARRRGGTTDGPLGRASEEKSGEAAKLVDPRVTRR